MVDSFSAFGGTFGLPTFWYVIWMTEKNLVDMAVRYLQNDWKFNGDLIFWRAPAFRKLRWDIFNCFDLVVIKRNKTDSFLDNPTTDIFFYQGAECRPLLFCFAFGSIADMKLRI